MATTIVHRPSITRLPVGAAEFVSAEGRRYYSRSFGNSMLDADGGIEAGQLGMVMVAARAALGFALQAFLHDKGLVGIAPDHLIATLGESVGRDSELYQRARDLLQQAPSTPEAAPLYAETIKRFVVNELCVAPPRFSEGNVGRDANDEYWQVTQQIDELASYLGMPSPFPIVGRPRFLGGISDPSTTVRDQV